MEESDDSEDYTCDEYPLHTEKSDDQTRGDRSDSKGETVDGSDLPFAFALSSPEKRNVMSVVMAIFLTFPIILPAMSNRIKHQRRTEVISVHESAWEK
jgi:hypothetical protein